MHELGIVLNVIDRVEEIARKQSKEVTKLTLEIGVGFIDCSVIIFGTVFEWAKKKRII